MPAQILSTKLYIPPPGPKVVNRSRLIDRLNEGVECKLTLISAPAGFGKTTLISEWVTDCERPNAWLSLDKGDNDTTRFLVYLVSALQGIAADVGEGVLGAIQSPQPPSVDSILTALLNNITAISEDFILVLDDYHVINNKSINDAVSFLLEQMPPQMHLVITTREDPDFPLSRLRARGQLTELRAADLRFNSLEVGDFLNRMMGLNLSEEEIKGLEGRTEGWIAGLQLAAISMRGVDDTAGFIRSFTGSNRFVMDYLVEEVLRQQPENVQIFLLQTSILDRLCGSLCDAVLSAPPASGQDTLEFLEHVNLFIISLDNERRWYRYHHLFAELLRQRLQHHVASSAGDVGDGIAALHIRASDWYEDNGLEIEAFQHAAAANDIDRAVRLIEGRGMPLQFRGALTTILNWLTSLSTAVLDENPLLWVTYATVLLATGQTESIDEKLQIAEDAIQGVELDVKNRDILGRIAATRAMLAVARHQVDTIISQSQLALEYLDPDNLSSRTATNWKLGYACLLQGDRTAAKRAFSEAITVSKASGNTIIEIMATTDLGDLQKSENQLHQADQSYQRALQLAVDISLPVTFSAYLGRANICYQWNELNTARQYGEKSLTLARQLENLDFFISCELFLVLLKLAQGDISGATTALAEIDASVQQHNFVNRIPELVAAQVSTLILQGKPETASILVAQHEHPISQARVHLAMGDIKPALAILAGQYQQAEKEERLDQQLRILILQSIACHIHGEQDTAQQLLRDALAQAEPGGYIRLFVDEGAPMHQLLSEAVTRRIMPGYVNKLLAAFEGGSPAPPSQPLIEPLSRRELEILTLVAQGLSNREIGEQLYLALTTVKGHNRNIFGKLQVQRRTEAVARARELGLV